MAVLAADTVGGSRYGQLYVHTICQRDVSGGVTPQHPIMILPAEFVQGISHKPLK
jgi:hypothetical protein